MSADSRARSATTAARAVAVADVCCSLLARRRSRCAACHARQVCRLANNRAVTIIVTNSQSSTPI